MVKDKSKKQNSLIFRIFKIFLIVTGILFLLVISLVVWIYLSLSSGPDPMEINSYHPFRSEKAKEQYLTFENKMAEKWPLRSEERFLQTSFGTTFIRISGPIDAQPVVLLPGGGCNSLIWSSNIKALSQNYRTYALDNIYDYGKSIYIREITSGRDFADWLNELFDTLPLDSNVRIIGYSFGGWVTSQYALYHPERLKRVILISPVYTILPLSKAYILRMITTLIPIRYFKEKIMYWCWSDLAKTGDSGKQLVEDRIDYYNIALNSFKFKQPVNPTVLTDLELQKLEMPLLFLVGEHETVYNAYDAISRLNRVNAKIKTDLIPDTGHDIMFTHTDTVNRKILDFLNE